MRFNTAHQIKASAIRNNIPIDIGAMGEIDSTGEVHVDYFVAIKSPTGERICFDCMNAKKIIMNEFHLRRFNF